MAADLRQCCSKDDLPNLLSYYVWTYSHIVQGCLVWTYEHIGAACSVRSIVVVSHFQCSHACSVVSFASKRHASDVCVSLVRSRCHFNSNPMVCAPSAWVSTPCANDGFDYSPDARALYKGHAAKVHKYVGFYLIRLVRPDSMDTLF